MNGKISNACQVGYLRRYEYTDGKMRGIKVIEIDNGVLRFTLNESKALDVMQLWHKGVNVSFVSKNGFSANDNDFLKRFEGGMLYTCGIDSAGGREGYVMHGTLHNIPALVKVLDDANGTFIVKAEMSDSALFGKNVKFIRTVKTELNSQKVEITDEIINCGTKDVDYCVLYHVNIGYPMLDKGVTIASDAVEVQARGEWAKKRMQDRTVFSDNVDNEDERCYFIKNKTGKVTVENKSLDKKFTLKYSGDHLDKMVQWCSSASGDYALGLEPTTTFLDDEFCYKQIQVGRKVTNTLELSVTTLSKNND